MLTREMKAELWNLYHLARTALADQPPERQTPYDRKLWAVKWFHQAHPEFSTKEIYLTFERGALDDSPLGREMNVVDWLMSARRRH